MTRRELPRSEWGRLVGTELEQLALQPELLPADTRIVVVEDAAGEIVGSWAGIRYVHFEGICIAPAHRRRGRVLAHLLAGMRDIAQSWGVGAVLTGADTQEVADLITGYGGQELPGRHFVLPVEGERCR